MPSTPNSQSVVNIMYLTLVAFLSHNVSQSEIFLTLMHARYLQILVNLNNLLFFLKIQKVRIFPIHFLLAIYKIFTPGLKFLPQLLMIFKAKTIIVLSKRWKPYWDWLDTVNEMNWGSWKIRRFSRYRK